MSEPYETDDRAPVDFRIRVWRLPHYPDNTAADMRARYVTPHLDELRADRELFHPAGPYISASFAVPSHSRQRSGGDSGNKAPGQLHSSDAGRPIEVSADHNISYEPTPSRTLGDGGHHETSSRRELIKRIGVLIRKRDAQRHIEEQTQLQAQSRAQERLQAHEKLLAQEQQRAQQYLQVEAQREVREQQTAQEQMQMWMEIQDLTERETITVAPSIELRDIVDTSPHDSRSHCRSCG